MNYYPYMQNNGIIWVQGEAGAKSYLVAPNQTVLLMDNESQRFYVKTADASGMPLPIRTFEYTEIAQNKPDKQPVMQQPASTEYVTKSEFEMLKKQIETLMNKGEENDGKPAV